MSPIIVSYTDQEGNSLPRHEVKRLALLRLTTGPPPRELAEMLVDRLDDEDLLQWATDEEGTFPDREEMQRIRDAWVQEAAAQKMVEGDPFP